MQGVLAGATAEVDHVARDQALLGQTNDRWLRPPDVPGRDPVPVGPLEAHGRHDSAEPPEDASPSFSRPEELTRVEGDVESPTLNRRGCPGDRRLEPR